MLATSESYSGCELFWLFSCVGIIVRVSPESPPPLQLILSFFCRRDTHKGARTVMLPTNASAVHWIFTRQCLRHVPGTEPVNPQHSQERKRMGR